MSKNISEYILDVLADYNVQQVFGVAGDAINPLVAGISERDDMQWVGMKHEGNASFAAFAQGELSQTIGVCASTVGPGALHLVNGLYNAKKERTPVLAITGQVPVGQLGTNAHQEVNLAKVYDDLCVFQAIIRTPEQASELIHKAIRVALHKKGVSRIELPADVAHMAIPDEETGTPFHAESDVQPSQATIAEAADIINGHKNIGILAGAGGRDAFNAIMRLSEKLKAPITHTLRASDVFHHDLSNVVGLTGLIGNPSGHKAVTKCEVLLMLGTDFPYSDFLPENAKIIQVDIRPENIGNRVPVDIGIHGDLSTTVSMLEPLLNPKSDNTFLRELQAEFANYKSDRDAEASFDSDLKPMHPQIVSKSVSDIASNDAIFTVDTGTSAIWASKYMRFFGQRRAIGAFNHGSMAVGLPAAIGAQFIDREREVWALVGDGAFHMSMQDFTTATRYGLPIKVIVFNNHELGFVKIEMEEAGMLPALEALRVPDFKFAEFAKLCGGDGIRVEDPRKIPEAVKMAKESKVPFVIDARVTAGELVMPPNVKLDQAWNFGRSKVKELMAALNGDSRHFENIKQEVKAYVKK